MLNAFLADQLARFEPRQPVRLVLELPEPGLVPSALGALNSIPNLEVVSQAFRFVTVRSPVALLPQLERVSAKVHYDAPRGIVLAPFIVDPVFGRFSLSPVTVPFTPQEAMLRAARNIPAAIFATPGALGSALGFRGPRIAEAGVEIVPTGESRRYLGPPDDDLLVHTRVAVIDTGATVPHPQLPLRRVRPVLLSSIPEPPVDLAGHGQWCTCAAFGWPAQTRFGQCRGVARATGRTLIHVKGLSSLGFGSTSTILKAMELAVRAGARVISMSLGGPLQGSVEEDPECQVIRDLKDRVIFVVAAGNAGPDPNTISSPGASPFAITVGAHTSDLRVSGFSSRGPNAAWYGNHREEAQRDQAKYGDDFIKPDCVAPGGGTLAGVDFPEVLYSGVTGWMNGTYDKNPYDQFEAMQGTSMATPQVAGLVALAYEKGLLRTAAEVKDRLRRSSSRAAKSPETGYGRMHWSRLLT